eukprot:9809866-Alexandrium_andersonii.AAC.1
MRPAASQGLVCPSTLGSSHLRCARGHRLLGRMPSRMAVASVRAPLSPRRAPQSSSSGAGVPRARSARERGHAGAFRLPQRGPHPPGACCRALPVLGQGRARWRPPGHGPRAAVALGGRQPGRAAGSLPRVPVPAVPRAAPVAASDQRGPLRPARARGPPARGVQSAGSRGQGPRRARGARRPVGSAA